MSDRKSAKFFPHSYATHVISDSRMASDAALLYRWTGTHWSAVDEAESEKEAYHWLVAQNTEWANPENARKSFRSACLFAPAVPPLTHQAVSYTHLTLPTKRIV